MKFTTGKLGNWEKYHQTYRVANVTLFSEPRGAFNVLQMNKVFSGEKKPIRDWGLTRWQKGRRFNTLTTLDHHFLQLHYDLLTSWNSLSLFCTSIIPLRGGDLCPGTFGTPKLRNAASRYLVLSWEANDACIINKGLLIEAIEATVHQSSDSRSWTLTLLYAFFFKYLEVLIHPLEARIFTAQNDSKSLTEMRVHPSSCRLPPYPWACHPSWVSRLVG